MTTPIDTSSTAERLCRVARDTHLSIYINQEIYLSIYLSFYPYISKVPVFDAITLADYVCTSRSDNPRFGAAFGRDTPVDRWQGLDKASMPAIGADA